jgi:hypothetical protein
LVLESVVYPYTLTLPAGTVLTLAWRPATRAWNGDERIDSLARDTVDATGLTEGGLYLFGEPAPKGLQSFFTLEAANGSRYHGCDKPGGARSITINGDPAMAFVQSCSSGQARATVSIVHNGFGLAAFIDTAPDSAAAATDRLVALLAGLRWTNG